MTEPVLSLSDLRVDFGATPAVRGVSFDVRPGEILALVGESGSGKSVSALSVLGLLPRTARARGSIRLAGDELLGAGEARLRAARGAEVGMVFQEPMTALNPVYPVGRQIADALRAHRPMPRAAAYERAVALLDQVGIPEPGRRVRAYPHELSGGQRQRAMIAMAICCDPKVLIADEPTTALDVTVQAGILDLLRELRERLGTAIVFVTHDMGVVADVADRVAVMRAGEIVEQAPVTDLFAAPRDPYTRDLLAAVPHLGRAAEPDPTRPPGADAPPSVEAPVLELRDVTAEYPGRPGRGRHRAIDGVSLAVGPGEVLGLVGESGSGKSTLGRIAVGLVRAAAGTVRVCGHDVTRASRRELRPVRRRIGVVFQDPGSSLNPRATIGAAIAEPLHLAGLARGRAARARVAELLDAVGIPSAWSARYPHELSGGQRQRVGIARAIAVRPDLLIADEPTSALDVSVQATVLDLLTALQRELGFACLFITHDLAVVEMLADRITVLRAGRVVETGTRTEILGSPQDPYTRALVAAAPVPDPERQRHRRTERHTLLAGRYAG